jgi:oligopeptide/dipeptide ABC transporter ATP-binding protein
MEDLLRVEDLVKYFPVKSGFFGEHSGLVHAVDHVTFSIRKEDTLGLVGESGCGKTTLGRLIAKLEVQDRGRIFYGGKEISTVKGEELKSHRREVQMVFQDPFESLNPRRTVLAILGQPFLNYEMAKGPDLKASVVRLLEMVGLTPGESYLQRYPHQFSGGQRQRIGIARAIALSPRLVIADEPVSSLDISIRAQILNLMKKLQEAHGLSYLFISHDLSVVRSVCNTVCVMYLGRVVEMGQTEALFSAPLHPYTIALLSATPVADPLKAKTKRRIIMKGDIPSAVNPPSGCRFRTRCSLQGQGCADEEPPLQEYSSGHWAACHRAGEIG